MSQGLFTGSCMLIRFILRRDRLRLVIWITALTGFAAGFIPVFEEFLTSDSGNGVFAEMMENPAMVAMVGPVYGADNYHTGAMYGNMMLLFSAILQGIMNIYLVTRHTRQEEEAGRLEVIRSLPVGRLSNLASVAVVAVFVNVILTLTVGLGMYSIRAEGMDLPGCLLFGACMGVTGLFFAVATAFICQITSNNRTASGLSLLLLMVCYMVRAAGDMGTETLSLISPLGLILRTKPFVEDAWWPVVILLAFCVLIMAAALMLARMRDLGRGMIPERQGHRHASVYLSGPLGLAVRLSRTSLIVWAIVIFVLGGMYGSVFGEMEAFLGGNEMLKAVFAADPNYSMVEQFIAMLVTIVSMIGAVAVLGIVHRIAAEEKNGRGELIFSKSVSRGMQITAYLLPAFLFSIVLQCLSALGFWTVGSAVLDTTPSLQVFMTAAFSYLPAIWVFAGMSVLLTAFLPDKLYLSYLYLGYSFITVYLGALADLPEWTKKLTPFGHISQYPVEDIEPQKLAILCAIALSLTVAGYVWYGRRDVKG